MFGTVISEISEYVGFILMISLLILGLLFCFKTRFVQFRLIKESCRLAFTNTEKFSPKDKNYISSIHAFFVSLGTRIGAGNVTGVCLALLVGGPGAIFWMWIFAIIGAATAVIECTIGQIYKEKTGDGLFSGGPAYYVKHALGKPKLGILFAVIGVICYGFISSSTITHTMNSAIAETFEIPILPVALISIFLIGVVIFFGFKGVVKVSTVIVPVMAVAYLLLALIIVLLHLDALPNVFSQIFAGAFDLSAGFGALLGTTIIVGVQRGMYSNEAGEGTMPMLTSSSTVSHPVKQGLTQSLGVFIDTLIVCSATAFMVLVLGPLNTNADSVTLLPESLSHEFLGSAAGIVVTLFIVVFCFTSIIGIISMGEMNMKYFTTKKINIYLLRSFILIFFLFSTIVNLDIVWKVNDVALGFHAILNSIILFIIGKYGIEALRDYQKQKKAGIKEPVFDPSCLSSTKGVTCWPQKKEEKPDEK